VSEASRILVPGGSLLVSEPRRIDPGGVPQEIAAWNATSIAARVTYSRDADSPDEEPIDEEHLLALLQEKRMKVDHIYHHWEIFPKSLPASEAEKKHILEMHNRYAPLKGNCVTVIAHAPWSGWGYA
jgi:SAM-dependent methyltransferase